MPPNFNQSNLNSNQEIQSIKLNFFSLLNFISDYWIRLIELKCGNNPRITLIAELTGGIKLTLVWLARLISRNPERIMRQYNFIHQTSLIHSFLAYGLLVVDFGFIAAFIQIETEDIQFNLMNWAAINQSTSKTSKPNYDNSNIVHGMRTRYIYELKFYSYLV